MKSSRARTLLVAVSCFLVVLIAVVFAYARSAGITGTTRKTITTGCGRQNSTTACHEAANGSLNVAFTSGPTAIQPGQTGRYTVVVPGNLGASGGGINIAASNGTLTVVSSNLRRDAVNGELTHTGLQSLPATFTFDYTAPVSTGTQTLYANGKGGAFSNAWNWASNFSISVITVPSPPAPLPPSSVAQTSFTANWTGVSGATSYRLDVAVNSGFTTFVPGYQDRSVNATSQPVTGLTAGTPYYYRVRAVNEVGPSDNSSTVSLVTVPPNPLAIAASNIIQTGFTANWNAAQSATGYRLDVSLNSGFTDFVTGYNNKTVNGTNDQVTGLTRLTTYYYRVRAVNQGGTSDNSNTITAVTAATSVEISRHGIPEKFELAQNFPNPFNPSTTIGYGIPKHARVSLTVFDMLGDKVATLVDSERDAGYYGLLWDAKNDRGEPLASGVYVYRLVANASDNGERFVQAKKVLLMR